MASLPRPPHTAAPVDHSWNPGSPVDLARRVRSVTVTKVGVRACGTSPPVTIEIFGGRSLPNRVLPSALPGSLIHLQP